MRATTMWAALAIVGALAPGCKKDAAQGAQIEQKAAEVQWPAAAVAREKVVEAWKAAGLTAGDLGAVDAKPFGAAACAAGKVSGLEVVLCGYGDAAATRAGSGGAREWASGARTLVVESEGAAFLAVADRDNADPKGQTIERIADMFVKAAKQ